MIYLLVTKYIQAFLNLTKRKQSACTCNSYSSYTIAIGFSQVDGHRQALFLFKHSVLASRHCCHRSLRGWKLRSGWYFLFFADGLPHSSRMSGLLWSVTSTSPSISRSLPTPRFHPLGIVIGPLVGLKSWGFRSGEPSDRLWGDRSHWFVRSQQIGARANDSTTQWATRLNSSPPSPTPLLVEVDSFENPLCLEASGYEGRAVSMVKIWLI